MMAGEKHLEAVSTSIEVIPATLDQAPILANLLELYCHDFSEFQQVVLGETGRFGYPALSLYWTDPDRHPLLVRISGNLGGFVLVKRGSEFSGKQSVWDMAEFFVVRGYRRQGVGTAVASRVWNLFPGPWEVRVMESNQAATRFWRRAITRFTRTRIYPHIAHRPGRNWLLFSFQSGFLPQ